MSTTPNPAPEPAAPPPAAPAPAPPAAPAAKGTSGKPVDNPHVCRLCGAPIRKNHQSYRGPIPVEMLHAIRMEKDPAFHVKHDICKACGESWYGKVKPALRPKPWFPTKERPLG